MAAAPRTEIIPYLFYSDISGAIDFLARAFGFVELMRSTGGSGGTHAEMSLDGQRIMMGQGSKQWCMESPRESGTATQGVFIYLADIDAHHARAKAAGARIDKGVEDLSYGRSYTAYDPDGHPWFFTTPPAPGG